MPRAADGDGSAPSQLLPAEEETRPQESQDRWTALRASLTSRGAYAGREEGCPAHPAGHDSGGGARQRALLLAALACCVAIPATLFAHHVWTAGRHDGRGSDVPSQQHSHDRPLPSPAPPPPTPPPAPPSPSGFERRSTLPALGSEGCQLAQPTSWYVFCKLLKHSHTHEKIPISYRIVGLLQVVSGWLFDGPQAGDRWRQPVISAARA